MKHKIPPAMLHIRQPNRPIMRLATGAARVKEPMKEQRCLFKDRIQGYLFANDIKMCIGICLGDVPVIQNEQYTKAISLIKKND